jgi:hypothetical protein
MHIRQEEEGFCDKGGNIEVAEEVLTRLGNGAVLEDFVMRKCVDR